MYHVNPASGNPGVCRADRGFCPFGKADAHFDSAEEARAFFETTQETLPKPAKRAKVYRVGSLEPKERHFDELQGLLKDFESTTPEGRPGRANGLFASPDLQSHGRWVLGNRYNHGDQTSHELSVDPEQVYVYPIELYEKASFLQGNGKKEEFLQAAKAYWDAGITLAEWKKWAATAKPNPGTWEVILPQSAAVNPRPVSNKRIIENSTERWHGELSFYLEPRRASKGLTWPRKPSEDEQEDED